MKTVDRLVVWSFALLVFTTIVSIVALAAKHWYTATEAAYADLKSFDLDVHDFTEAFGRPAIASR